MLLWATFDQNSVIVRVKILDSAATTGAGKTGLTSSSSGLIVSTIADSEATATVYTVAASNVETITTLGTYAAPTSGKCRFKELDATNHPGVYELQFADARFSVAGSKSILVSISGATGAAQCDAVIPLPVLDLFAAQIPANVTQLLGTAWLTPGTAGTPDVNAKLAGGTAWGSGAITAASIATDAITDAKVAADVTIASVTGAVGSVTADVGITQSGADKVWSSTTRTLSAFSTALAASVWDVLESAIATASSIGLKVKTNLDAAISSRMATYTQPSGFLATVFPAGTVASSAEVTSIQNNTRCVRVVPEVVERPDSGTTTYRIELLLYDDVGNMEAPDSAPTIALVNQAGTDLSARLDSSTMALVSTGRYRAVYTSSVGDTLEQLVWAFTVVEGGATRIYGNTSVIVDTTAVDFTAADRAKLDTLHDTRIPGVIQPQTGDAFSRIGATGSGLTSLASQASVNAIDDFVDTEVAAILAAVDTEVASILSIVGTTGAVLTAEERNAIADAKLVRQITESYAANGVAPTEAQALMAIHQGLMQFGIAGTAKTVRKLDNTTPAFVITHDSATAPTDAKRV